MNSERLIGTLRSIGAFVFSRYGLRFRSRARLEAWQARRLAHFITRVMPRGARFKGLTSALRLCSVALLGTLFVLAANTLLRPLVNQINRHPVDNTDTEVTYRVTALIRRTHQKEVLPWLEQKLEQANYPLSELDIEPFGEQDIEISAVLLATSIDGDELDALMKTLGEHPRIKQIFWRASTTD